MYRSYPRERRSSLYGHGFTLYCLLEDIDRRPPAPAAAGTGGGVRPDRVRGHLGQLRQLRRARPLHRGRPDGRPRRSRSPGALPVCGLLVAPAGVVGAAAGASEGAVLQARADAADGMVSLVSAAPARARRPAAVGARDARDLLLDPRREGPGRGSPEQVTAARQPHRRPRSRRAGRGARPATPFEREQDYYADLQQARFGITVKRAGWDCLRHYELAANGCVPCFRDLESKPPRCAPHGLDESNCVPYRDYDELMARLEGIDERAYRSPAAGGAAMGARRARPMRRARQFLEACGLARGAVARHGPLRGRPSLEA